ncbi:hypothetical protein DFH11DRAFT_1723077 [Phellopilus nigrolimitatus]|nr:hypothetical protein DFH11DRAFT_1723077 [Phellopilus nigrolimitatus]
MLSFATLLRFGSLVLNVLDLFAADTEPEEQKMIKDTLKNIAGAAAFRTTLLHAVFSVSIPDPALPPPTSVSDSESESILPPRTSTRICSRELTAPVPPLRLGGHVARHHRAPGDARDAATPPAPCALRERAAGVSVCVEIEQGCADRREENREYWAKVNKRWTAEGAEMGLGVGHDEGNAKKAKAGPPAKDAEKDKARLSVIEHAHALALQAANPCLAPLSGMRGGTSGGAEEERWWGFADPAEIRQLAKWIAATEELDCKDADVDPRRPASHAVEMDVDSEGRALDLLTAGQRLARMELKALGYAQGSLTQGLSTPV